MFSKLYTTMSMGRLAVEDFKSNPIAFVQKLERGDADSSGSTMRTAGVVALILLIFASIISMLEIEFSIEGNPEKRSKK